MRCRRLVRDCERTTANSEVMIWAAVIIMTKARAVTRTASPDQALGPANGAARPASGYTNWPSVVLGS